MARAKRVSAPILPKAQIKTGRAKRGIAEPVARVVRMNTKMNTPRRKLRQRPELDVMADLVKFLEQEFQVELV